MKLLNAVGKKITVLTGIKRKFVDRKFRLVTKKV